MTKLEVASTIAANPHLVRMRTKQTALRERYVKDYGPDYYVPNYTPKDLTNPDIPVTRYLGVRGVTRWTVAEEAQYNALTERMKAYRATLREVYAAA